MERITSVLVAGAGAIGSMVATKLHLASKNAESGLTVSILAGGERLDRYRKDGFIVNGEKVNFTLTDSASLKPVKSDLVIVACKNHHLATVLADLSGHIGKDTLILSLMNGITSEDTIGAAYGTERVPYAMIVGTDAGHSGNITTYSSEGTIFFGDAANSSDPKKWSSRVALIADCFDRAHIAYKVPENMLNRLWYKYMLNVGVNQVTAILDRPYRAIQTSTMLYETRELLESAMMEVMAIAAAEGITLTDADIDTVYRTMDGLDPEGKTSMCQDVEAGRKTEVELFAGQVIALGKKHGIPVPVNELFWKMLRAIETSYYP
jgi:2-dehydropantoate 2-reductase